MNAFSGTEDPHALIWLQTRDGSPTLWSNEWGESFRSIKGAFTESWAVFAEPALEDIKARGSDGEAVVVGEFGLGVGTNWLMWSFGSALRKVSTKKYFVIENQLKAFEMGFEKWRASSALIAAFWTARGFELSNETALEMLESFEKPEVYPSLEAAAESCAGQARVWFHDPFGYEVNPEGYSEESLQKSSRLWSKKVWGGSYACNRNFQKRLAALGMSGLEVAVVGSRVSTLKRERLEFRV